MIFPHSQCKVIKYRDIMSLKKSEILSNLREYTEVQIAEAVKSGTVTMYELSKSGKLTPLMRCRIEKILASEPKETLITSSDTTAIVEDMSERDNTLSENIAVCETPKEDSCSETYGDQELFASSCCDTEVLQQDVDNKSNKGLFKRPFSFKGRIRRLEYGISYIIYYVYTWIISLTILGSFDGELYDGEIDYILIWLLLQIPSYWFLLAQNTKRCHDRGNSGWWQLIPFYGLWLLFADGEKCSNEYGNNPKE